MGGLREYMGEWVLVLRWGIYARDDGTHFDGMVERWLLEAEFGGLLRCCRSEWARLFVIETGDLFVMV